MLNLILLRHVHSYMCRSLSTIPQFILFNVGDPTVRPEVIPGCTISWGSYDNVFCGYCVHTPSPGVVLVAYTWEGSTSNLTTVANKVRPRGEWVNSSGSKEPKCQWGLSHYRAPPPPHTHTHHHHHHHHHHTHILCTHKKNKTKQNKNKQIPIYRAVIILLCDLWPCDSGIYVPKYPYLLSNERWVLYQSYQCWQNDILITPPPMFICVKNIVVIVVFN